MIEHPIRLSCPNNKMTVVASHDLTKQNSELGTPHLLALPDEYKFFILRELFSHSLLSPRDEQRNCTPSNTNTTKYFDTIETIQF